jgi:hypothetical protein
MFTPCPDCVFRLRPRIAALQRRKSTDEIKLGLGMRGITGKADIQLVIERAIPALLFCEAEAQSIVGRRHENEGSIFAFFSPEVGLSGLITFHCSGLCFIKHVQVSVCIF